jgi:hypothetical protein
MRNTFIALGIAVIIILGFLSMRNRKDNTVPTANPTPPISSDQSKGGSGQATPSSAIESSKGGSVQNTREEDNSINSSNSEAKDNAILRKEPSVKKAKRPVAKLDSNTQPGEPNEGSVREQGFETESAHKAQRASGHIAKIEDLTSIYPQSQQNSQTESLVGDKKTTVIAGVPIQSWVLSEKNSLSNVSIPEARDLGLKVYYWCMELKKQHFEYAGTNRCKSILESQHEERVAAHFRGQPG